MTTTPPPYPVVEAGDFECKDAGKRSLAGLSPASGPSKIRLTVGGSPVVTVTAAGGSGAYTGCGYSDNSGPSACNSTTVTTTGAGHLSVGGAAVLLSTDKVASVNPKSAGSGSATVHPGQSKLTAS